MNNALWLIFGKTAQAGLTMAVGILTARYLGPSDYGLIHYAAGFTGFFAAFCTLGLPSVLVRELTDAPEQEGHILGTALALQTASSLCSAAVILRLIYGWDGAQPTLLTVAAWSCAAMVLRSLDIFHCHFQSKQLSRISAVVLLISHTAALLCKAALLALKKPVAWFAFAAAAEQFLSGALLLWTYRRLQGRRLRISREMSRQLLRKSCHFILPALMVSVYAQTDRIMLARLLGEGETGCYSAAVTLCGCWCFVLSAIIDAMYPEIAGSSRNAPLFDRRNRQLYAMVFYISAAVSVVFCLLAEPLVLLFYGPAFLPAAGPVRILTWYTAFSYLGVARNAWVVCRDAQKHLVWIYAAAALVNVGLNNLLIPRYGASGAAAASLAAQLVSAVIAPAFHRELRENSRLMLEGICLRDVFGREEIG